MKPQAVMSRSNDIVLMNANVFVFDAKRRFLLESVTIAAVIGSLVVTIISEGDRKLSMVPAKLGGTGSGSAQSAPLLVSIQTMGPP